MKQNITHYIRAGYPGLYLVSHEEQRVEAELKAVVEGLNQQPPNPVIDYLTHHTLVPIRLL
ncbi:MAG: hypothetical protein QOE70_6308 [Chthoniobacter sp.]|jgi:hypothetical protein|nr:hypothetical protein [Chthoniobacter sp.]